MCDEPKKLAQLYASQGFAVAIDQVIYPHDVKKHFENSLSDFRLHKIFLEPELSTARDRNAKRQNKDFDTAFLDEPIVDIYRSLEDKISQDTGWLTVNSTDQRIEDTVAEIIRKTR
jgi:hypothetical protein